MVDLVGTLFETHRMGERPSHRHKRHLSTARRPQAVVTALPQRTPGRHTKRGSSGRGRGSPSGLRTVSRPDGRRSGRRAGRCSWRRPGRQRPGRCRAGPPLAGRRGDQVEGALGSPGHHRTGHQSRPWPVDTPVERRDEVDADDRDLPTQTDSSQPPHGLDQGPPRPATQVEPPHLRRHPAGTFPAVDPGGEDIDGVEPHLPLVAVDPGQLSPAVHRTVRHHRRRFKPPVTQRPLGQSLALRHLTSIPAFRLPAGSARFSSGAQALLHTVGQRRDRQ